MLRICDSIAPSQPWYCLMGPMGDIRTVVAVERFRISRTRSPSRWKAKVEVT